MLAQSTRLLALVMLSGALLASATVLRGRDTLNILDLSKATCKESSFCYSDETNGFKHSYPSMSDCQALGNDVAGRSEKVIVLQGGKDSNYQVFGARSANCKAILYKEAAPNQDVDTPQIWIDRDQLSTFIKDKTKDCLSDDPSVRTWDSVLCTIEYTAGKPPLTIAISSNDGIIADGQHV